MTSPLDPTQFTRASAERIGLIVRTAELTPRPAQSLEFEALPDGPRKIFRIATFTGAWSKAASKTVTFAYQSATPNTAAVTNLFADVPASGMCAIARDGTAWFLIAAECSTSA